MPFSSEQRNGLISKARRSMASAVIGRRIEPGRRRKPRVTPYKQDARDGNNNGRVQDGTVNERPVGTDIVDGKVVPSRGGRKVTVTQTKPVKQKKPTAKQQAQITEEQRKAAIEDLIQRERERRIEVAEAGLGSIDPETMAPWAEGAKRAAAEREIEGIPSSVVARINNSDLETRRLRSRTAALKKKYRLKNISVERILSDEKISQEDRDAFARDLLAFFAATPYVTSTKKGGSRGFPNVVEWARARARGFASDNPELVRSGLTEDAVAMAMALTSAKVLSDRSRLSKMSGRHHSDFLEYLTGGSWKDKGSKTLRNSAVGVTGLSDIDDALEAYSHRALLDTTGMLRDARAGRLREGRVKRTVAEREQQRDFIYKSIQKLAEDGTMSEVEKAKRRERLYVNMDQEDAMFTAFSMASTAKPEAIYPQPRQRKMSLEQQSLAGGMRQMLMSIMPEQVHVEIPAIDKDGKTRYLPDGSPKRETRRVDLKSSDLADLTPLQLFTLLAAANGYSDEEAMEFLPDMDSKGKRMTPTAYRKNKQAARDRLSARLMNRGMADSEAEVDDAARRRMIEQQRRDEERREFYSDEYNRYARAVQNYRQGRDAAAREMLAEIRAADTAIEEASTRIDREDANSEELKGVLKRAVWARAGAERDMLLLERERLITNIRDTAPYLLDDNPKEISRRRAAAREQSRKMVEKIRDIEFEISVRKKRNAEFAEVVDATGKMPRGNKGKDREITLPSGKTTTIPPYSNSDDMRSLNASLTRATREHNANFSIVDDEGAVSTVDARAIASIRRVGEIDQQVGRLNDEFGHVIGDFTEVPMYDGSDTGGALAGRDPARVALSDLRDIPVRVNTIPVGNVRSSGGQAPPPTPRSVVISAYREESQRVRVATSLLPSDGSEDYRLLGESIRRQIGLRESLYNLRALGLDDSDDQVIAVKALIKDIENGDAGKSLARKLGVGDGKRMPDSHDFESAVSEFRIRSRVRAEKPAPSTGTRRRSTEPMRDDTLDMPIPKVRRELERRGKKYVALADERRRLETENRDLAIMANQTGDTSASKKIAANRERIKDIEKEMVVMRPRNEALSLRLERHRSKGRLKPEKTRQPTKKEVAASTAAAGRQQSRARVAQIAPELKRLRTQRRNEAKRLEGIGVETSPALEQLDQTISSLVDERRSLNRNLKSEVKKIDVRLSLRTSLLK